VAACQKLTELTVVYPHPGESRLTETACLLNPVETARSAASGLAKACKSLPDFDLFQIVHFSLSSRCIRQLHPLGENLGSVKDLVINCLKEGEGRKKTTVRVVRLAGDPLPYSHLDSAKVEEYEV
jgi:hypothetical protein